MCADSVGGQSSRNAFDDLTRRSTKKESAFDSDAVRSILEPAYGKGSLREKRQEWKSITDSQNPFLLNDKGFPDVNEFLKQNDKPKSPARLHELHNLDYRGKDRRAGPDAMVLIPPNFDRSKPINLVLFNHGWASTAGSAYNENALANQMKSAAPNTVLIVPEWQKTPGSSNSRTGQSSHPGQFDKMLQEVFRKTPELAGKSLADIRNIDIFAHSAGYTPTNSMMYSNEMAAKVKSITMLDANYEGNNFETWLASNKHRIASGELQFNNFFNDTSGQSRRQAARVAKMLRDAGIPAAKMFVDYNQPNRTMTAAEIQNHPIVFKFSNATLPGKGPHAAMPGLYIRPVLEALKNRRR